MREVLESRPATKTPGIRESSRMAVRGELARSAMDLFVRQGFDQTTVADVAAAAGVSARTFFRYFATKEDAVLAHLVDVGHATLAVLHERPENENLWVSLRAAFEPSLTTIRQDSATSLTIYRLLMESPALRATHAEKTQRWSDLLEPEVARRLQPAPTSGYDARPRAVVSAALACFDAACFAWARSDAAQPIDTLLDDAIDAVRR